MPRTTQAYRDARRREILEAAFRCFARRGFHATTMQEIADEAGLSAGAPYRYFDGKQALIEALAGAGREQKREALQRLQDGGGADALTNVVRAILESLRAPEADAAVRLDVRLWGEALDHGELRAVVAAELDALVGPIADHLRAERAAGRIRGDADPGAVARAVVALLIGFELQRAYAPDLDVGDYAAAVRALLAGL